ncbi:MAG TPA: RNA methyltransferase [Pyrinomonadaceae bacterium]|nr:RNA methyltransferase [Pyrinomonadaceae bacterium]
MLKINSRDNQKLKLARKVRDGHLKDLIFVEGLRLAEEALRSEIQISEVFVVENFDQNARNAELLKTFQSKNISISEVPEKLFGSIADTKTSQGIILLCEKPPTGKHDFETKFTVRKGQLPVVVLLHEINNPSNLGAILRTAEAVNAAGIIITKNSADVFSPKSLRASMGAGLRLNIWTNTGFDEALDWSREKNLISTAADINAAKSYTEIDWQKPRLLIFGSEAHGLRAEDFQKVDEGLIIPMENGVESLNLAVSCGIILFEAKSQSKK